jgi:hypothetical protein
MCIYHSGGVFFFAPKSKIEKSIMEERKVNYKNLDKNGADGLETDHSHRMC